MNVDVTLDQCLLSGAKSTIRGANLSVLHLVTLVPLEVAGGSTAHNYGWNGMN